MRYAILLLALLAACSSASPTETIEPEASAGASGGTGTWSVEVRTLRNEFGEVTGTKNLVLSPTVGPVVPMSTDVRAQLFLDCGTSSDDIIVGILFNVVPSLSNPLSSGIYEVWMRVDGAEDFLRLPGGYNLGWRVIWPSGTQGVAFIDEDRVIERLVRARETLAISIEWSGGRVAFRWPVTGAREIITRSCVT